MIRSFTLRVADLMLQETGTYNPMFTRPYNLEMNGFAVDNIANRVAQANTSKISGTLLSGVASEILRPTAYVDPNNSSIMIPAGWNERRVRFILAIEVDYNVGGKTFYYFQGYTDYPGITESNVDPNMTFIINSFVGVSRTPIMTPSGMSFKDIITESSQVLSDPSAQTSLQGSAFSMRPQDVFQGMTANYMKQGYSYLHDDRFLDTRNVLRSDGVRSSRVNNTSSNYMAKVIDGYLHGNQLSMFGQSNGDIIDRATEQVFETPLSENPFIRAISDIKGIGIHNRFTYNDLMRLDPNTFNMTKLMIPKPVQRQQMHQAGQTAYWNGADEHTTAATCISHAVPALMMDMMIFKTTLFSTNHTVNTAPVTNCVFAATPGGEPTPQQVSMLCSRLETEVLRDLTFNNQIAYRLKIDADLMGETRITIALGNNPEEVFVVPSFCDSLYVPVITPNHDRFVSTVSDFETLLNNVVEAVASVQNHQPTFAVSNAV